MSEGWICFGNDPGLQEGEMRLLNTEGLKILLAKVAGKYYAAQSFCAHMGGDLSKGKLDGYVVSCPRNVSKFDIRDGHVVIWMSRFPDLIRKIGTACMPPKQLKTFIVKIEKDEIFVKAN